jgi:hypothetical protein
MAVVAAMNLLLSFIAVMNISCVMNAEGTLLWDAGSSLVVPSQSQTAKNLGKPTETPFIIMRFPMMERRNILHDL